jgi:ribose 5-phosphate isomerase A
MTPKERAARSAVAQIRDGDVVGLGTGSTVYFGLVALAERIRAERLRVVGVPTSVATQNHCLELGIPLTDLERHPRLDIAFDGADQVDAQLDAIKGYGGALLREKIVARCANRLLLIVDASKVAKTLDKAVPVEVLPFGVGAARTGLGELGGRPHLRAVDGKPFVSDNGNWIVDVDFGNIPDPARLAAQIDAVPGVIDHGLFVGLASEVHVADENRVLVLQRGSH